MRALAFEPRPTARSTARVQRRRGQGSEASWTSATDRRIGCWHHRSIGSLSMARWPYNTTRWNELRAKKLKADPLCQYCPADMQRRATCVDHKRPIRGEGDAGAWEWSNLVSSCLPCHSQKTARGSEAGAVRTSKPRKGCSADGTPLDRGHWWRRLTITENLSQLMRRTARAVTPRVNSGLGRTRTRGRG